MERIFKALDLETIFKIWKAKRIIKALDLETISSDIDEKKLVMSLLYLSFVY